MRCQPDRKESRQARGEDPFGAKFVACSRLRWSELAISIHLNEVRAYPARMRAAIIDAWHKSALLQNLGGKRGNKAARSAVRRA